MWCLEVIVAMNNKAVELATKGCPATEKLRSVAVDSKTEKSDQNECRTSRPAEASVA